MFQLLLCLLVRFRGPWSPGIRWCIASVSLSSLSLSLSLCLRLSVSVSVSLSLPSLSVSVSVSLSLSLSSPSLSLSVSVFLSVFVSLLCLSPLSLSPPRSAIYQNTLLLLVSLLPLFVCLCLLSSWVDGMLKSKN